MAGRSGGDSGRRTLPSRRRLALHPPLRAALRHGLGDVWRVCAVEALVLVAAVAEVLATRIALPGLMLPGALLAAGVLPLRRRFPRAVMLVALPTLATGVLWLPAMAALHAVAVSRRRREVVVAAAAVAVVSFVPWRGLGDYPWTLPDVTLGLLLSGLLAVAPAALGRLARARRELAARLGELALSRDRERRYAAEQAALRERERLARDVHDTAAHHLSLISLRSATLAATAESAEYRAQAEALGDLSRRAAADLSETVRRAGPGLARLPQLLQAAGAVAVRLDLGACPQDVERTAYRVVQEGLTNARRHAPGARVEVDVHRAAGALRLSVRNGPAPLPAPTPEPGGGHGLPGLRARTTALGGTFTAFPTPDGGFAVEATVPLGAAG
ncbi:histidine kinase [Streptomyces sp. NPDC005805]|uniref:sensor histidine kinase n=1 Tax=Streptomyces sp. NPDC005805 TaxID=3157068 RepID=UPI0033FFC048